MQTTDAVWAAIVGLSGTRVEYKYNIAGTDYLEGVIESHSATGSIFGDGAVGIGNANIGKLDLQIWANNIPRSAKIMPYCRLVNDDTGQVSGWIKRGEYWVSKRSEDDGLWTLEAYDAMRRAETAWDPDPSLDFPLSMSDAVDILADLIGVDLESGTVISSAYEIDYPTSDMTIRLILQYIAAAHGGNWIITPDGKLRLVKLGVAPSATHQVGQDAMSFDDGKASGAVSRVTLLVDAEHYYTAGDDTGITIEATCPYATQTMTNTIASALTGYQYHTYEAGEANVNPAYELGDGITVFGVTSIIAQYTDRSDGYPDVSLPIVDEDDDEYSMGGPVTQLINRKIAETESKISKTADSITLEVTEQSSASGTTTARIKLKVGSREMTGQILMDGNVDISGQLSADALYTTYGDMADLAVNRINTSRRIPRYLAGDLSDDNFLRVENQRIQFVAGSTTGASEQAVNPQGEAIYWESDPDAGTLGPDGYPYLNGRRIWMTTTTTLYPVMVYTYTESVKREISFDGASPNAPLDVFGAGYGEPNESLGKGYIQKTATGMDMWLHTSQGKKHGIFAGDDYTDIVGMRKTKRLDFSGWDDGIFRETVDGINTAEQYNVEFDGSGRPVKITDDVGHATTIVW